MQYLLLIYSREAEIAALDATTMASMMDAYRQFTQSLAQAGQLRAADRLRPTSTATTVRIRDGKVLTTDGPFAETREQLGGFYLVEAKDLNDAIQVASRIPGAKHGSIEVRPVRSV